MMITCALFHNVSFGSLHKSIMVLSQFDIVIVWWLVSESLSKSVSKLTEFLKNNSNNFDRFFHEDRQS